ncbi:STAS domain-containing protein [Rubrobacter taiwanensis]|uniref:STAS domain-containing protein n=1 Tax=Rubrobacter taiwanensis TaxID=185139 RepID=UPI0014047D98|nr:STAS domain-containing protein [Rubrobacter taiwanensis]
MDRVFRCYVEREAGHAAVVPQGEVDLQTAPEMQACIEEAFEASPVVILDMSGIEFMDSTALSVLIRARSQLGSGLSLRLAAPSKAARRILEVTGAADYFDIYPSREEAAKGER